MTYKIQKLTTEMLQEILVSLPDGSLSHRRLFLALRDGPQPVGRVIDEKSGNFLLALFKEPKSPGDQFFCFLCNGVLVEFLTLYFGLGDIVLESVLPAEIDKEQLLRELSQAFSVNKCGLVERNGEIVAVGSDIVPVIKG